MPDFDIDFCQDRRDEVIRYVRGKYGQDNVGQIITFGSLKARSVIRDVVRVMGLPFSEGDRIAKLVPDPVQGKTPPLKECIENEPRLQELYDAATVISQFVDGKGVQQTRHDEGPPRHRHGARGAEPAGRAPRRRRRHRRQAALGVRPDLQGRQVRHARRRSSRRTRSRRPGS